MTAFLTALAIVFLAEMGDKTQLLAMAFAARFRWRTVMLGVFVATAANHLLAVYVGNYLTGIIPLHVVKIAAAVSFILFGLWTIRGDKIEGEDKRFNFSPFWTVTVAFFLAEMGDKTQLATVALAAQFNTVAPVWAGTTTGMLIADAVGIAAGVLLHKKIPEKKIKWFSALVFIAFGMWGLYEAAFKAPISPPLSHSLVLFPSRFHFLLTNPMREF
jgi:Ca2+/H+ antiporter, TMEM165/GDT1 family